LYIEEKDYTKAFVALEMAVKKLPRDYNLLNNFGVALTGVRKFNEAKDQYKAALSLNSTGREAMMNLAILQIDQLKNYQDGLDIINKLRFLGPPESARIRLNILENKAKAGQAGGK
jgi:Flp pilus assembly protein TadD